MKSIKSTSRLLEVFLFILLLQEIHGFSWVTNPSIPSGSVLRVCRGQPVKLAWNYALNHNEELVDIQWSLQKPGQAKTFIGTYAHGHFYLDHPDFDQQVISFLPPAGLVINSMQDHNIGIYTVVVNVKGSSVVRYEQAITLELIDHFEPPVVNGKGLSIFVNSTTLYNKDQDAWFARFKCGQVNFTGLPKVDVLFHTPSGNILAPSSNDSQGNFYLDLPYPLESGNYSCQFDRTLLSSCLSQVPSNLLAVSNVTVDAAKLTWQLLLLKEQQCNADKRFSLDAHFKPQNCDSVQSYKNVSGVHRLYLPDATQKEVLCDQQTEGGGWIVFQRRLDGSVDFYRDWESYKHGFGDLSGEFWLGLEALYQITHVPLQYDFRVEMELFNGTRGIAEYGNFTVHSEQEKYKLHLGSFLGGNAGDSMYLDSGMAFTTKDRNQDFASGNCAKVTHSAWWFKYCNWSDLNGNYTDTTITRWNTFSNEPMKTIELKIRVHQ